MVGNEKDDISNEQEESAKQNMIDTDLYEEFTDEELQEHLEIARQEAIQKQQEREEVKARRSKFSKWTIWVIALLMLFQVIALIPETYSIPAVKFLKTSAALSTQSDIKQYKKAVVLVETEEGKGTGFAFSTDGKILTNHHVVEGYDEVNIGFRDEGYFVGEITEDYPDEDLAVIELKEDVEVPALTLAVDREPESKEDVYFIGNPLKFTGIANKGVVLDSVYVKDITSPVMMMDAPVYRGNSGSPVIDQDGEVIGVVFATMFDDEAGRVGLFIPIQTYYDVSS